MAKYYVEFEVDGKEYAWEVEAGSDTQAENFVDYEFGNQIVTFIQTSVIGDCA